MKLRSKFMAAVAVLALVLGLLPGLALADEQPLQAGSMADADLAAQADNATAAGTITRLGGKDAYGTMVQAVNKGWKKSDTVVIARFDGYWDALAASALAGSEKAPVLLTNKDSLSAETKSLITSLGAKKAYICGGSAAVSADVEKQIKALGLTVQRFEGKTAYNTAEMISAKAKANLGAACDTCVIATIDGFYDSLSVAPVAYSLGMPIYLTNSGKVLASSTVSALKAAGYTKAVIVGGTAAVKESVKDQLVGVGIKSDSITRLGGKDAWATSELIAEWGLANGLDASTIGIADGNGYWDALTGAPLVGLNGGPLVLVPHAGSTFDGSGTFKYDSYCIDNLIAENAALVEQVYIFGGEAAVSKQAQNDTAAALAVKAYELYPTNEELMWVNVKATLLDAPKGQDYLVVYNNGVRCEYFFSGTMKDAKASTDKEADPRWAKYEEKAITSTYKNSKGAEVTVSNEAKYGFKLPITLSNAKKFTVPIASLADGVDLTDRRADIDLDAKTVTFGNAKYTSDVEVKSTVADVKVDAKGSLFVFGYIADKGGTSNEYTAQLTGTLTDKTYDAITVDTYKSIDGTNKYETTATDGEKIAIGKDGAFVLPLVNAYKQYQQIADGKVATIKMHVAADAPYAQADTWVTRAVAIDYDKNVVTISGEPLSEGPAPVKLAVTNNVKMFKPATSATLESVAESADGPKANLVLPMDSDSMSEVFVGMPAEAAAAKSTIAFNAEDGTFTIPLKWTDGEPFVMSFHSKSNGTWYGRQATLDEKAGTLVFDPWTDPAPANTVDEKIAKIQSQSFTDTTWADCEDAKAAWDALSDAEKDLVEEYDYFGLDTGNASKDDPLNQDEIGENEILVVSFGTSFNDSRVATIGGVEKALAKAYPDWSVRRAFTAQIIINHIYARDGEKIDNVKQAMDRAVANGVKNLVVQPTHLMHGAEYDELKAEIDKYADKMTISYAEPLLGEVGADSTTVNADKEAVAKAVVAAACKDAGYADAAAAAADGAAIVLMGHGTAHSASITYEQMQAQMGELGYKNVFVGTVEGEPESTECSVVIGKVADAGYTKVFLRPMMVVAGDHANNDMADPEDEESWVSQFTASGKFSAVTPQIAGLGEIPEVQQIYVAHTGAVINAASSKIAYDGAEFKLVKEDLESTFGMLSPAADTTVTMTRSGGKINVKFTPKNTTVYKGIYLDATIDDSSTWVEDRFLPITSDGVIEFSVDESYAGFAWPIAPTKVKAPTESTSEQYYMAIPPLSKIPA